MGNEFSDYPEEKPAPVAGPRKRPQNSHPSPQPHGNRQILYTTSSSQYIVVPAGYHIAPQRTDEPPPQPATAPVPSAAASDRSPGVLENGADPSRHPAAPQPRVIYVVPQPTSLLDDIVDSLFLPYQPQVQYVYTGARPLNQPAAATAKPRPTAPSRDSVLPTQHVPRGVESIAIDSTAPVPSQSHEQAPREAMAKPPPTQPSGLAQYDEL